MTDVLNINGRRHVIVEWEYKDTDEENGIDSYTVYVRAGDSA